jgi:hypothetical protein
MAHRQLRQADGEPQEAPGPPIALNRMASAEIAGLEPVWADPNVHAHQLEALSEEDQLQEVNEPPVPHHCATCTDPACMGPVSAAPDLQAHDTSVRIDAHTARSKTPTDRISQEHAGPAAPPDVTCPEHQGPDLFAKLSPEIREMIFKLVYADTEIIAATQGFCACSTEEHDEPHQKGRHASPVLLRGWWGPRGTRKYQGHYIQEEAGDEQYCDGEAEVLPPINSLLFVNKQTYLEALPHLCRVTTFFFDDTADTQKFVTTVGPHFLKLIRTVEVFADDDEGYSGLFACIVSSMPNIERLTIGFWEDFYIKLQCRDGYDDYGHEWAVRHDDFEKALLQFGALENVRCLDVEPLSTMSETWSIEHDSYHTRRAVERMIETGDQRVLNRHRRSILKREGRDFAEEIVSEYSDMVNRSGFTREWWLKRLKV